MISIYLEKVHSDIGILKIEDDKNIRHLNVLRVQIGEKIRIVDGEYEYLCEIYEINKKSICVKILEKNIDTYSLNVKISVALGLIKQDKFTYAVQKLTEIGVDEIIPLKTDNTVVKSDKKEKWDTVVIEAMKQCQAVVKTKISDVIKIKDIDFNEYDIVFLIDETAKEKTLITNYLKKEFKKILYIVGPEGGFSSKELDFLKDKSISIGLGKRILRAETAAIYVASIISNFY